MYYWNPQRLKELKAKGYKLHSCQEAKATSLKRQATSQPKPEPSSGSEASSSKHQASSNKPQA